MYEMARQARDAMKSKAQRMVGGDGGKLDASSFTPAEPLNAQAQTGLRPISRRQYKEGGAVTGAAPAQNAGRMPRKSGGKAMTANTYVNRDVREANEERDGIKHVGGFRKGGRIAKMNGGDIAAVLSPAYALSKGKLPGIASLITGKKKDDEDAPGMKRGGTTERDGHTVRVGNRKGFSLDGEIQGTRPTGGRLARATGGSAGKGKMNVNININTKPADSDDQNAPPPPAPPPMQGMPPPGPPPPPPNLAAPPPMVGPPPMGRKSGGRVKKAFGGAFGGMQAHPQSNSNMFGRSQPAPQMQQRQAPQMPQRNNSLPSGPPVAIGTPEGQRMMAAQEAAAANPQTSAPVPYASTPGFPGLNTTGATPPALQSMSQADAMNAQQRILAQNPGMQIGPQSTPEYERALAAFNAANAASQVPGGTTLGKRDPNAPVQQVVSAQQAYNPVQQFGPTVPARVGTPYKVGGSVRTNDKPDGGSGGGLGRLEKIKLQRKAARK